MSTPSPGLRIFAPPGTAAVARLQLVGELDLATAAGLRARLRELLHESRQPRVYLLECDLGGLSFLDAAGLSVLVEARNQIGARGGALVLRNPAGLVRRVLEVLDLLDAFGVPADPQLEPRG